MRARTSLLLALAIAAFVAASTTAGLSGQAARKNPASAQAPSAAAKKISLPPLPSIGYAPARPIDVARAAYQFAGEHPEVLRYVPCYCGCESVGHRGNESCFVKRRDAAGNVLEWDLHGFGCAVCIDVARESMQLFNSGADPVSIRAAIERKWTPQFQTKTPTPLPPKQR
jgi:hypothetical protein